MAADGLLLVFGVTTALLSLQLPLGTLRAPGSGLFPFALGLLLVVLAACHMLRRRRAAAAPESGHGAGASHWRVLLFLASLTLATALLGVVGFPVVAFLLMWGMLRILGVRRGRDAILIALGTAIASYVLFVQWLKIPLPKGWIGL
jgi:hypothetical protein